MKESQSRQQVSNPIVGSCWDPLLTPWTVDGKIDFPFAIARHHEVAFGRNLVQIVPQRFLDLFLEVPVGSSRRKTKKSPAQRRPQSAWQLKKRQSASAELPGRQKTLYKKRWEPVQKRKRRTSLPGTERNQMKLRLTKRNVYMTERKRENSEYNVIDVNRKIAENVVERS